jgi:hypothetical protein
MLDLLPDTSQSHPESRPRVCHHEVAVSMTLMKSRVQALRLAYSVYPHHELLNIQRLGMAVCTTHGDQVQCVAKKFAAMSKQ